MLYISRVFYPSSVLRFHFRKFFLFRVFHPTCLKKKTPVLRKSSRLRLSPERYEEVHERLDCSHSIISRRYLSTDSGVEWYWRRLRHFNRAKAVENGERKIALLFFSRCLILPKTIQYLKKLNDSHKRDGKYKTR